MTPEPDALDFVNLPEEVTEDFVDTVTVAGAEYPLTEFTQAERHLWFKVRDESNLMSIVKEFGDLRRELEKLTGGALVEKKEARIQKLDAEIDTFIDSVTFDEWSSDHDKRLEAMVASLEKSKAELAVIQSPLEERALDDSGRMQSKMDELRERQQLVNLKFVWHLAKLRHKDKRSWEEFMEDSKGSDRQNASEVVQAGNFTWETQATPSMRNRAMRRASRKN